MPVKHAGLLLLCATVAAGESKLDWQLEGYPRLFEAAARARKDGKRLLVGLSGSPT